MKLFGKIFLALSLCFFSARSEAASEWVKLETEDAEGYVIDIQERSYIIDVGVRAGARKGVLYLVYADRELHGVSGEVVGYDKIPLAVLKVREAMDTYSRCIAAPPSNWRLIQPGDKVTPISPRRAKRQKFAAQRPGQPSDYAQSYGGRQTARVSPADGAAASEKPPVAPDHYYIGPADASGTAAVKRSEPPHPPYPPYPPSGGAPLDFDANKIADARLIRTFPLSQPEMNSLEIEHRAAWALYANKRYLEAFDAFSRQYSAYRGNYLSPYWAGMSALKLKNVRLAVDWFNRALAINPYHEPARSLKQNAHRYAQDSKPKKPVKKTKRTTKKVRKKGRRPK